MNWKKELRVSDLPPDELLEIVCKKCGNGRYLSQVQISAMPGMKRAYLDEVEKALECHLRFCKGPVRLSRTYTGSTEGFVGGMA